MAKKQIVKLTESDLQNIIKESVSKLLKEGHYDTTSLKKWNDIREAIGDDAMISELWNWLNADDIDGFIEHITRNYDLDYNFETEEFDED